MFKQIVSNLSLSPAAAGQLSFYAKRLKQEKATRTFSVIAAVLLIGLQFTVISAPSKPSNAASPSDLIPGGFQSLTELLSDYDHSPELQAVYGRWGVTRNDLVHSSRVQINSRDHSLNSLGRVQHASGDTPVPIYNETFWARYLYQFDTGSNIQSGSYYYVQTGISSTGQYYAIMYRCGNIVFHSIPPAPPTTVVDQGHELYCTSLTGTPNSGKTPLTVTFKSVASGHNETVTAYHYNFGDNTKQDSTSATTAHVYRVAGTYKATLTVTGSAGNTTAVSSPCSYTISTTTTPPPPPPPPPAPPKLVMHKVAQNETQKKDATKQNANAGDVIEYTLSIKNTGGTDTSYAFSDDITDILEYATVTKLGDGKVTTQSDNERLDHRLARR